MLYTAIFGEFLLKGLNLVDALTQLIKLIAKENPARKRIQYLVLFLFSKHLKAGHISLLLESE